MQFQNLFVPNFLDNVIFPFLYPSQMCKLCHTFEGIIGSLHIKFLYCTLVIRHKSVLNFSVVMPVLTDCFPFLHVI